MLRKLSFVAVAALGLWIGQGEFAAADHNCHSGYNSGYRQSFVPYGVPGYSTYRVPYGYAGRPLYGGGYPASGAYYGSAYGSGINAPFGGYGSGGFPRYGSYGMGGGYGPGFSLYIGR